MKIYIFVLVTHLITLETQSHCVQMDCCVVNSVMVEAGADGKRSSRELDLLGSGSASASSSFKL